MQILQIILLAILIILAAAVLIICLILFFPFKIGLKAKNEDSQFVRVSFSWLFRLVYATYTYEKNEGVLKLFILGLPFHKMNFFRNKIEEMQGVSKDDNKKINKKKTKNKTKKKTIKKIKIIKIIKKKIKIIINIFFDKVINTIKKVAEYEQKKEVIALTLNTVKQVLSAFEFSKFDVFLKIGFDDPSSTGYFTALLSAVMPFLPKKIVFSSDFEKEIFLLKSDISTRSTVWKVGYPIIKYIIKLYS